MSSHLYGYGTAQSAAAAAAAATAGLSSVYTSRALTDSTLRYLSGSDAFASATDHHSRSSYMYLATSHLMSQSSWPAPDVEPGVPGVKRPSEALYHQSFMGAYNTIGQEAWYSALAKRPRYESASNLPIYPQRPGEKDCAHYMLTRTCKFGELCKFDHPIWVPEGGIPDWKEAIFFHGLRCFCKRYFNARVAHGVPPSLLKEFLQYPSACFYAKIIGLLSFEIPFGGDLVDVVVDLT